jgi:hypothetical protein
MPVQVPWTHLIRFIAEEDGQIHYGDAIVPDDDFDIGLPDNAHALKARLIEGNPLSPSCIVTKTQLSLQRLLGPLTKDSVPAVRCIGGNYKTHREQIPV